MNKKRTIKELKKKVRLNFVDFEKILLQNAPTLAIVAVRTAEKEPPKDLKKGNVYKAQMLIRRRRRGLEY